MRRTTVSDPPRVPWHTVDPEAVFEQLGTGPEGLPLDEVESRLERYGLNQLPQQRRRGPLARLADQFNNLLIYVLLGAALVTALLAHWVDTGVILGVVVINALIGFLQEGKAEKALDAIRGLLSPQATVIRAGRRQVLAAEHLVPGDVVVLQSGDKVPADLRLFRVRDLRIEEASLTGESVPVEKDAAAVEKDALLGDRSSMAYASTLVTYGQGAGVVVATGAGTELGHISAMLGQVQTLTTPLLKQIAQFGRWLTGAILLLGGFTFLFGVLFRDYSATEMFLAAVGLVVAAIPEGLPAIITITLAIGVQRMARRNGIIRLLPAVETLGAVSVICSDKTGTLTRNEMTVQAVVTAGASYGVTGVGYDPHGAVILDGRDQDPAELPELNEIARAALLCNDAQVREREGAWQLEGDPTEGALVTLALKCGLDADYQQQLLPRADTIPFESEHRFMATLHHDHAGHGFVYLKGAPEKLVEMCSRQRRDGEDVAIDPDYWHGQVLELGRNGLRTLALAFRPTGDDHRELGFADVDGGLTLLGLVGIIDPPRREAIEAVARCRSAGIRVKMITGDHAVTAMAIAGQMGIGDGSAALTGTELEELTDAALRQRVGDVDVFARTSPEHKLRLVTALQAEGQVVAMTGDGVNDAPALKRSNVGVAMGRKGTEVAKEAAEMVLADDNFASISHAVEEGRTVYDNIKKSILFILPTNGAEALILVAAVVLGRSLPITPVQILWVNMITAVTLALSLAFEPPEQDVMGRPPRRAEEPILSGFLVWRIVFVSIIAVIGSFGLFIYERQAGMDVEYARTVAVNTLVMFEAFYLLNTRYIDRSVLSREGLLGNRYVLYAIMVVVLFQLLYTYLPWMQLLFQSRSLDGMTWLRIVPVAATVFVLVEMEKALYSHLHRRGSS